MLYRQAVSLDSMDLVIRKPAESERWFRRLGGISVRAEAAESHISLLDRDRDSDEIASLRAQIAEDERRPRAVTPAVTYGPNHVTERGKYLNVWQSVNGSWKLEAHMWNIGAPAPTPPGHGPSGRFVALSSFVAQRSSTDHGR